MSNVKPAARQYDFGQVDDMKSLRMLVALSILVSVGGCVSRPPFEDPFTRLQIAWKPSLVLDVGDAGRILGIQSHVEQVTAN